MKLSKRDLLKGSLATVASLGSVGPALAKNCDKGIPWDKEVDVLVIGYGGAGASAAIAAKDNGSNVLIVEKMSEPGGNTSVSSGQVLATKDKEKTKVYISNLFKYSRCELDPKLLDAYVEGLTHTLDWMKSLEDNSDLMVKQYAAFPFVEGAESMIYGGFHGASTGGPRLMQAYRNAVEKKRNIEVWLNSPAKRLLMTPENGVIGAEIEKDGKKLNVKAKRGVIITTGGYEYDDETKTNFNLGSPMYALGCPGNTGDGLRMVSEAGAGLWHMSGLSCPLGIKIPGHTACQAFRPRNQIGYILVDQLGRRFADEKRIEHHIGILSVNHYEGYSLNYPRIPCYAIFDQTGKERGSFAPSYGSGWLRHREKWNWSRSNDPEIQAGIVKTAPSIEELAKLINVPAENLSATAKKWNDDLSSPDGIDKEFGRIGAGEKPNAAPLQKGPFYALTIYPTLLNTQGGPRHNEKAQVLNSFKEPIKHLYVAGELGSFWGFIYQGCGNNAESLIFGHIAGENAAKETPWS